MSANTAMNSITISDAIRENCPKITLGCIACNVKVEAYNHALWQEIQETADNIKEIVSPDAVNTMPAIAQTRMAYKAFDKDPSRYRPSAEALLRRIATGKGLYQTNNIVDLINVVSVKTGFSIGGYDAHKIKGSMLFDVGKKNEPYEAIGRGTLNIHGLPVFRDELGAFGSPTSDSVRTMITPQTQAVFLVIMSFGDNITLDVAMNEAENLLKDYGNAANLRKWVVK